MVTSFMLSNEMHNTDEINSMVTKTTPPRRFQACFVILLAAIPSFMVGQSIVLEQPCHHHASNSAVMSMDEYMVQSTVQILLEQKQSELLSKEEEILEDLVRERVAKERLKIQKKYDNLLQQQGFKSLKDASSSLYKAYVEPGLMNNLVSGMALTNRTKFIKHIDLGGVPLDPDESEASHVLFLYRSYSSLPDVLKDQPPYSSLPELTFEQSAQNCDVIHVYLMDTKSKACWAFVPQHLGPPFHAQRFQRMKERNPAIRRERQILSKSETLKLASRAMTDVGIENVPVPNAIEMKQSADILQKYFGSFERVQKDVQTVIHQSVRPVDNAIVVMVSNHGQSELLMNFVCNARSRLLDLSSVLVFATDQATLELARSLGLATYFDKENFGPIPVEAALEFGDSIYTKIVIAKSICAQLISSLGYDFLFQDVDVIWYRDPLRDYFLKNNDSSFQRYDMVLQDDCQHTKRNPPFAANSGFYFVRNNKRTRNFLNTVLLSSEIVFATGSHQVGFNAILSEHVAFYGLKVKVVNKASNELPTGWHYTKKKDFMKQLLANSTASNSVVFHMSWTRGKEDKIKYFEQMNEWFVNPNCIGKNLEHIGDQECCLSTAHFECHFRNFPSIRSCNNSPMHHNGPTVPFW